MVDGRKDGCLLRRGGSFSTLSCLLAPLLSLSWAVHKSRRQLLDSTRLSLPQWHHELDDRVNRVGINTRNVQVSRKS